MALILVVPAVAVRPISDPSPWLHLKVGAFLAAGHRFDGADPWAPFAAANYEPTQWLPSVATALLVDRWGLPAVAWARGTGILLLLGLLLWTLTRICRPWLAAALSLACAAGSWPWLTERPQLLGFVLLVPVLSAWLRTGHDQNPRWWLIPLTWLAACTHGVWSLGLAVGGLVLLGLALSRSLTLRSFGQLTALMSGCVLAAGITPLGPRLLLSPLTVGANGREFVSEWMPSSIRTPSVALVMALLVATWVLWLVSQYRPPIWQLLLFGSAIFLCLTMQRTVPVAAILSVFLCAEAYERAAAARQGLASVPLRLAGRRAFVPWIIAALLSTVGITAAAETGGKEVHGLPQAMTPTLTAAPAGTRVLAFGDLTGWLMYTAPELTPVFDLRIELYAPRYVRQYISAMHAEPGWERYVSDTGSTMALLKADCPLTAALTEQLHWKVTSRDAGFVLLEASR